MVAAAEAQASRAQRRAWCCQHCLMRCRSGLGQLLGSGGLALSTPTAMITCRGAQRVGAGDNKLAGSCRSTVRTAGTARIAAAVPA